MFACARALASTQTQGPQRLSSSLESFETLGKLFILLESWFPHLNYMENYIYLTWSFEDTVCSINICLLPFIVSSSINVLCLNTYSNILSDMTFFCKPHLPVTWRSVNIVLDSNSLECSPTSCVTWLESSSLPSWCLSAPICKIGIIMVTAS